MDWITLVCNKCQYKLAKYGKVCVECYCITSGNPETDCYKVKEFLRKEK